MNTVCDWFERDNLMRCKFIEYVIDCYSIGDTVIIKDFLGYNENYSVSMCTIGDIKRKISIAGIDKVSLMITNYIFCERETIIISMSNRLLGIPEIRIHMEISGYFHVDTLCEIDLFLENESYRDHCIKSMRMAILEKAGLI